METVEIRISKIKAIPIFVLLVICYFTLIWYCFISGEITGNVMKIIFGVSLVPLAYLLYGNAKMFFRNQPYLVLHKSGIDILLNKSTQSFLWSQVTNWTIKRDRYMYLVLETTDGQKTIRINYLDKTPAEIEALMQQYKPR